MCQGRPIKIAIPGLNPAASRPDLIVSVVEFHFLLFIRTDRR